MSKFIKQNSKERENINQKKIESIEKIIFDFNNVNFNATINNNSNKNNKKNIKNITKNITKNNKYEASECGTVNDKHAYSTEPTDSNNNEEDKKIKTKVIYDKKKNEIKEKETKLNDEKKKFKI